jgi:hypothetical protein
MRIPTTPLWRGISVHHGLYLGSSEQQSDCLLGLEMTFLAILVFCVVLNTSEQPPEGICCARMGHNIYIATASHAKKKIKLHLLTIFLDADFLMQDIVTAAPLLGHCLEGVQFLQLATTEPSNTLTGGPRIITNGLSSAPLSPESSPSKVSHAQ